MVKFRSAGDGAAYEIAVGVHDAEEAAKLKLAVVETDPTTGAPTAYGRYKDAPDGGPLGITVPKSADSEVIGAGQVSASETGPHGGGKGNLINPDDPVIHGGSDDIHKDGAEPPVEDLAADEREARDVAEKSNEKVQAKAENSRK
jgi:hypothetical protein